MQSIERLELLDPVAEKLQATVRRAVPQGSRVKDALSGTWLGHPLHPPLTDVVVGSWASAAVLDLFGPSGAERAVDRLIACGVLAALPTALSGMADWAELSGGTRRVGSVHAIGNTTALALHAASWRARWRGERPRGRALSLTGMAVATASAWLGGHLSFGKGVGVNQTAFEDWPSDWTRVAASDELEDGGLTGATAGRLGVVLVKSGERIAALADRCSHRGCALHRGRLEDGAIVCACHGSTLALDGSVVKGPATAPQPALDVRVDEGQVEVRRPPTAS